MAVILRVRDHAHNLEIAGVAFNANAKAPSDRIFIRQEAADEFFSHHRDAPRGRRIMFIDSTAEQNVRAERLKIAMRDTI